MLSQEPSSVVNRLRRSMAEADLDCGCQEDVAAMLDRLDVEEGLARRTRCLVEARKMRDAIVLVMALLGELDDLMPDEPDRGAFGEIAGLFQDVADFAAYAASSAIRAAGQGNSL